MIGFRKQVKLSTQVGMYSELSYVPILRTLCKREPYYLYIPEISLSSPVFYTPPFVETLRCKLKMFSKFGCYVFISIFSIFN